MIKYNLQFFGGRGASNTLKNSNGKRPTNFENSVVKKTLYHGTNADNIKEFKTTGRESNGAIFFSDDPDYAEEEAFIKAEKGGKSTMYDVKLNIQNPFRVTIDGSGFGDPTKEAKYIREAKEKGYDSVIFDNGETDSYMRQEFYAVFDPKQVKILKKHNV